MYFPLFFALVAQTTIMSRLLGLISAKITNLPSNLIYDNYVKNQCEKRDIIRVILTRILRVLRSVLGDNNHNVKPKHLEHYHPKLVL